jgi:hypothetical protein
VEATRRGRPTWWWARAGHVAAHDSQFCEKKIVLEKLKLLNTKLLISMLKTRPTEVRGPTSQDDVAA